LLLKDARLAAVYANYCGTCENYLLSESQGSDGHGSGLQDYIKQVPFDKTMNTCHANTEPAKYEACSFHTKSPLQPPPPQWPKISDQPKYKRWRIQWREDAKVKSKTFSYRKDNRANALQAAEQFRSDQFS
jgi:hypothetical protein